MTERAFVPLAIAVVTVSDTRTIETDTRGALLESELTKAGHRVAERVLVTDDLLLLRATFARLVAERQRLVRRVVRMPLSP